MRSPFSSQLQGISVSFLQLLEHVGQGCSAGHGGYQGKKKDIADFKSDEQGLV
jgi:hypothetical protein